MIYVRKYVRKIFLITLSILVIMGNVFVFAEIDKIVQTLCRPDI